MYNLYSIQLHTREKVGRFYEIEPKILCKIFSNLYLGLLDFYFWHSYD